MDWMALFLQFGAAAIAAKCLPTRVKTATTSAPAAPVLPIAGNEKFGTFSF